MQTIDKNSVMNRIINSEAVSDIWMLDPNEIKGTRKHIAEGMGYLIFKQVNTNMKLDEILKDGLIFVIFNKEDLEWIKTII